MTVIIKKHIEQNWSNAREVILENMQMLGTNATHEQIAKAPKAIIWQRYQEEPKTHPQTDRHMMIDIETLDTCNTAVVLSIGAVEFELHNKSELGFFKDGKISPNVKPKERILSGFYAEFDCQDQKLRGRTTSPSTLQFWKEQSPGLEQFPWLNTKWKSEKKGSEINYYILSCLAKFMSRPGTYLWANGTDFDLGILKSLFGTYKSTMPGAFFMQRDFRTIAGIAPMVNPDCLTNKQFPENKVLHHALADAIHQALKLQTNFQILSGRKPVQEDNDDY